MRLVVGHSEPLIRAWMSSSMICAWFAGGPMLTLRLYPPLDVPVPGPFSSPGPLRNGEHKPDLAAPGSMLIAARSTRWVLPPG